MQHRTKANILVTTFGRDTIDNGANYFINIALEVLRKHVLYWTEDLLYYMIGTEKEPARKFCCWLLELDHSNIKRYHSKEHSHQIDLEDLFSFYCHLIIKKEMKHYATKLTISSICTNLPSERSPLVRKVFLRIHQTRIF